LSATEMKVRCFFENLDDRTEADNREGANRFRGYLVACDKMSQPRLPAIGQAVKGSGLKQHSWTAGGGGETECVKGPVEMGSDEWTRRRGLEVGRGQESILRGI